MLRTLTLPLAVLLATGLQAQIQIGQNEMPHAGDELHRTRATPDLGIDYASTGPAHEWDFSDLTAASEDVKDYVTVGSTNFIYSLAFADIFFNTNRANHATEGTDIPFNQLLPIENPWTFLYHSATVYRKVGYGVELSGIPVPIIFSSPDVIYELPLDYGDVSASNSGYELNIPSLAYYGYSQERNNEVDGWGTIATPAGVFEALRVKSTVAGHDTIAVDTLSVGFNIDRPVTREYKWLAQGIRVPVLQINTTELFGTEIATEIWFYDLPHTITVVQPLAATLCPGSTFALHYEATGSYNTGGFFIPANHFTAQLSSANGDFTNATTIGQVTASVSGTIEVTIPPGTPPGTGYRIRVNSDHPAYTGQDNGFDITIDATAPSAVISAGGPTEFCGGGAVTLNADPVAGTYQWQLDGDDIPGANGATYDAAAAGDYTLLVTNACGSDVSDAITVSVGEAPVYAFDQAAYLSCDGVPVTITAVDGSGQGDLAYEWYLNGNVLGGEDGPALLVGEAGSYSLTVTNTVTGCAYTADPVEVSIDQVAAPVISADGPEVFCAGGSVGLSVEDVPGVGYQWSLDGTPIDGATGTELTADAPGAYTVTGTSNGCVSGSSDPVTVVVNALPGTPVIEALGGTAYCAGDSTVLDAGTDPGLTYQWSLDGTDIVDGTGAQWTAAVPGEYAVTVSTGEGCTAASAAITITENALPAQPVITQDGDQLNTTGEGTFQWYFEGQPIDGATDSTYAPLENGAYNVAFTDANGCTGLSDAYAWISTAVGTMGTSGFALWPNPAHDRVSLSIAGAANARVEVFDAAGRTVLSRNATGAILTLDMGGNGPGMYFVRVTGSGANWTGRLLVQ